MIKKRRSLRSSQRRKRKWTALTLGTRNNIEKTRKQRNNMETGVRSRTTTASTEQGRDEHDHQRGKSSAIFFMTLASGFHFASYEWARAATTTLLTMLPVATGCIWPFSLILLYWYTQILQVMGPKWTLWTTTCAEVILFLVAGVFLICLERWDQAIDELNSSDESDVIDTVGDNRHLRILSWTSFILYVAQNGFVQLLYTQHWSFLGSMHSGQSKAVWFAPVAGLGSIISTVAAASVGIIVEYFGLYGLLIASSLLLLMSGVMGFQAYQISIIHGFAPKAPSKLKSEDQQQQSSSTKKSTSTSLQRAWKLFGRVPLLSALAWEVWICQCLSSLLHFWFVWQCKAALPDNVERAAWTGRLYASINACSGVLQFVVIPAMTAYAGADPRRLWPLMPLSIWVVTAIGPWLLSSTEGNDSARQHLYIVAASFFLMKLLEYSWRAVSNEMCYADLDFESRYVGKEWIGLFANRLGKSGTAVALSLYTVTTTSTSPAMAGGANQETDSVAVVKWAIHFFIAAWFVASVRVTNLVFGSRPSPKEEKIKTQ